MARGFLLTDLISPSCALETGSFINLYLACCIALGQIWMIECACKGRHLLGGNIKYRNSS